MTTLPEFIISVLAAWLGATVVARAPRDRVTRVFGLLTLLVAVWGAARVLVNLSNSPPVRNTLLSAEVLAAGLLPAALLHLVLATSQEKRRVTMRTLVLGVAYTAGGVVGILSATDRTRPVAISPPNRSLLGIPGDWVGWSWIALRAVIIGLAVWWSWQAWRAGRESIRNRQLTASLAAVACGAAGGVIAILASQLGGPVWIGSALIALSLVLASYAVLVQRLFLAPDVARRSFYYSILTGLITAVYIGLLLGLERSSRQLLAVDSPVVTLLAVVLTIAWFDPVRLRFRRWMDRRLGSGDISYTQLLRSMGEEMVTAPAGEGSILPALSALCASLSIRAAAVEGENGRLIARYGEALRRQDIRLELPLKAGGADYGRLLVGVKRSWLPYSEVEKELLGHAAAYMAASLHLATRQAQQSAELSALSLEREALRAREAALAEALTHADTAPTDDGLHVWALGALRVEYNGEIIRRWGGAKAGTRQAEAVFAFLLDRGERGVAKDEFIEVIWPDVALERADLAFHRTLGGLRRLLEPDLKHGSEATMITYHNDRYRLHPSVVSYSDVQDFESRLSEATRITDEEQCLHALEEARALYRGEYLDDCPFYGDSLYVEERRALLRGRYLDLLLAIGELHERRGATAAAADAYRQALQTAEDDCPRADDGLARLGLPL